MRSHGIRLFSDNSIQRFNKRLNARITFSLVDTPSAHKYSRWMNLESYNRQTVWCGQIDHHNHKVSVDPGTLIFFDDNKFFVMAKTWTINPKTQRNSVLVDRALGPFFLSEYHDGQINNWNYHRSKLYWTFSFYPNIDAAKRFMMRCRLLDYNISTKYTDLLGNFLQL